MVFTYQQMWELIVRGRILKYCTNATLIYHSDFSKYMKVEGHTFEKIFDYLFDVRVGKFLNARQKRYL